MPQPRRTPQSFGFSGFPGECKRGGPASSEHQVQVGVSHRRDIRTAPRRACAGSLDGAHNAAGPLIDSHLDCAFRPPPEARSGRVVNVFVGDGEARERARAVRWSETALGMPETWSSDLRIAVDICLQSESPMLLAWGPELVQIYNDGCCPLLGSRHPGALGQPARECWSDLWERMAPVVEGISTDLTAARTTVPPAPSDVPGRRLPITLSLSPLRGASGGLAGILVTALDTGAPAEADRRAEALAGLMLETAVLTGATEICEKACEALVRRAQLAPWALAYLLEPSAARLVASSGMVPASDSAPERVQLTVDMAPDPWRLAELTDGHVVDRMPEPGARPPQTAEPHPGSAALVVPMRAPGREGALGALIVGAASPSAANALRRHASAFADVAAAQVQAVRRLDALRKRTQVLVAEMEIRSRFLAGISHELRTPISAIMAHAEICREGYAGDLTERQARHIGRISTAAVHLLGQVEEILEFSRRQAGFTELNVQDTEVGPVIEELSDLLQPLFRERGLHFEVRVPEPLRPIRTDRAKLRQILINLLSNAQKYTTAGSVHLVVEQDADDSITATVIDTGSGIDPSQQKRIFEPFERVAVSDDPGGTGLGLTVARSLARLLGGDVTVRSAPGEGSAFTVRLGHAAYGSVGDSIARGDAGVA